MNPGRPLPISSLMLILSLVFATAGPAQAARVEASTPAQGGSLYWNTFLGGGGWDHGIAIAVDTAENIYVSGSSEQGWGNPVAPFAGLWDAYVLKLRNDGTLDWLTFLGGIDEDYARGMAIDSDGSVYVVGISDATWGNPVNPFAGGPAYNDAFVAKLDNTGALVWNTFLGGSSADHGYGIAVDAGGNVHVTGASWAGWGEPVSPFAGDHANAFAARLDASGGLVWNTFLGGMGEDLGVSIAVDGSQALYVAGGSESTWGTPVRPFTGGPGFTDAFVAKLQSDGALAWNTFLGGGSNDLGVSLAVDGSGNIFTTGWTESDWGTPVSSYTAYTDAFVARLDGAGGLAWNTFLGGEGYDYCSGLAIDESGNLLVAGQSTDGWGTPVRPFAAGTDAFAAALDLSGARSWNTFLGGSGFDQAFAIAADGKRNAYLTGGSDGGWGNPIDAYAGSRDAFVARLGMAGKFRSAGGQDGWVLESAETSTRGATMNATAATFNLGDDAADRQYRSILSFDTSGLPEGAVITKATLRIKRQGIVGTNPFNTHMGLKVDIRKPYFGASARLAISDFQAAASKGAVGTFNKTPAAGAWYSAVLSPAAYPYINLSGTTQLRLRFARDDNDDRGADYLKFYSGNAGAAYRPVLVIEYSIP